MDRPAATAPTPRRPPVHRRAGLVPAPHPPVPVPLGRYSASATLHRRSSCTLSASAAPSGAAKHQKRTVARRVTPPRSELGEKMRALRHLPPQCPTTRCQVFCWCAAAWQTSSHPVSHRTARCSALRGTSLPAHTGMGSHAAGCSTSGSKEMPYWIRCQGGADAKGGVDQRLSSAAGSASEPSASSETQSLSRPKSSAKADM